MRYLSLENHKDIVLLISRVMLMILLVLFGIKKLYGFEGTVSYMNSLQLPFPFMAAVVAVFVELVIGVLIMIGFYTRPLSVIMIVYVLATSFIGHPFWNMSGSAQYANEINFFKNISILGGLLLLCLSGPGRFSLDRR